MFNTINKKKISIKYITLILLLIILFSYFYSSNIKKNKLFVIEKVNHKFYIIPEDSGGKIISDYGIGILENEFYQYINKNNINLNNDVYSLQIAASDNINLLILERDNIVNKNLFNSDNLFIKKFNSELGISYILLYNSYFDKNIANTECSRLLLNNIKCIIINISNLE